MNICLKSAFNSGHKYKMTLLLILSVLLFSVLLSSSVTAADVEVNVNGEKNETIDVLITLTMLALVPSILIMTTSFTRIIIALSFLRSAMGLQQTPPNQVLIGIALFLSLFIMSPVLSQINETAYVPYQQDEITQEEFIDKAAIPLKNFMLKQTKAKDLELFRNMSQIHDEDPQTSDTQENLNEQEVIEQTPLSIAIPAFITSELKRAFLIGFLLYIPFIVIDMIVASTLMSMGMIMLPPVMISMPFKLLLFVLVDGWGMLFESLVSSFNY